MRGMRRFLVTLACTLTLVAGGDWLLDLAGRATAALTPTSSWLLAAQAWALEAVAFVAVARLLVGRGGLVVDGLVVGGLVWVLRWPLMLLTLAQLGVALPVGVAAMAQDQLLLDLAIGLVLAFLHRPTAETTS